jgi:uncharacterized protein (TIGR03437 family)
MRQLRTVVVMALAVEVALYAGTDRINQAVDPNRTAVLTGQVHPLAQPRYDQGLADPAAELGYVTLLLRPDPALKTFLAQQRTPSSASYRRWLAPEEFADRFGLTQNDIGKITAWLGSQGLRVNDVARGRHWITFSGTAGQISQALHTEIHRYAVDGKTHLANATDPSIPQALQGIVAGFRGLNDFIPVSPLAKLSLTPLQAAPEYTSGGVHFLAPGDLATIYDVNPLYNTGIDGTGQTIVIAGQTDILLSDIAGFRSQFGLPANQPKLMLFGTDPGLTSDLQEADLDLQWAGALAPGATIVYAYSTDAYNSLQYAVDQNLGKVISISYGSCELYETPAFEVVAQQANAQGITVLAASGDAGATNCDRFDPTPQASTGPVVSWPASFPEITSVGGTEFNEGTGSYWGKRNNSTGTSALSYIPETAWNDTVALNEFASGGGGASVMFSKPSWQTGPGVPNDNARDLPDVSLSASWLHDPFLIEEEGLLYLVGGTSAATPSFAGMVALLNQYLVSQGTLAAPGLGNINPALYQLAQSTPASFHDIVSGNNSQPCVQSSTGCVDGLVGFNAGPGYDLATGLGSVDVFNLVTNWNSGAATTTSLTANPAAAGLSDTVQMTATVKAAGTTVPTGSISFVLDGVGVFGQLTLATVKLAPGSSTATFSASGSQLAVGNGTIQALYSGDEIFEGSASSVAVSLTVPVSLTSMALPFVTPNPVVENGEGIWPYTVALTEVAGVATTLTSFTINGDAQNLAFWTSTKLPAHGTIYAELTHSGMTTSANRVFVFNGTDASGQAWTQQISVPFLLGSGAVVAPGISLTTATPTVPQNLQAPASCQWSQQVTVQEQGGYVTLLDVLSANGVDMTPQIQTIFGTTRLAPYGMLQGSICYGGGTSPSSELVELIGISDSGGFTTEVVGTAISTLLPAPAAPVAFSSPSNPTILNLAVGNSAGAVAPTTIPVNFSGGSAQWTASVAPANLATAWLSISPQSGKGPGSITVTASPAGLSPGAYTAVISIAAANAQPQVVNVTVTLTVGASAGVSIAGIINNFSGATTAAPGMMTAVFGTQLAPAGTGLLAPGLPLPLTLAGVSATVNGVAAPLYYVSPAQIDLQIPYETGAGTAVLAINNNGQIATFAFPVAVTAPGLYPSAINNTTGKAVQSAATGSVLLLFMTGEGDVTPTLATGATPAFNSNPAKYPQPRLPVTVTVGGVPAQLLFQAIPYGLAGATQIDFTIPATAPTGPQQVVVTVGGVAAPPVNLTVTAPGS